MPRCPTCHRRLGAGRTCPDDGGVAPSRPPGDAAPPLIPGYTLETTLGAGGFATVWAARAESGARVAVKVAHAGNQLASARLIREATILTRVGPPWVPRCHEQGALADGRTFVAMELLAAPTLAATLESQTRAPELDWVASVSDAILAALAAVHKSGTIHRDLKPDNIFLDSAPPAVTLVDFGLALAPETNDQRLTGTGVAVGSIEYSAPEQLRGEACDVRTDLYAFGVILFELMTLRPPFVGDATSVEHGHRWLRPPHLNLLVSVPRAVDERVSQCLAKQADARPASADELRSRLEQAWRGALVTPSGAGQTKSSLLVAAGQPVVLLVVDSDVGPARVSSQVKREGGFVARQVGNRYVSIFPGFAADDPVDAALATAARLADGEATRCALHLTSATIKPRRRGPPAVIGQAIDRPEEWLPEEWTGLVMTRAVADTRPRTSAPARGVAGFFSVATDNLSLATSSLVGREQLLTDAEASFRRCLDDAAPSLLTIVAASGLGKSRLAAEIAARVTAICPPARVESGCMGKRSGPDAQVDIVAAIDASLAESTPSMRPMAVIVDDAHRAGHALLDRIERAALDRAHTPLWVVVIADPSMVASRKNWGKLANRHQRLDLEPLTPSDLQRLAAELLLPAEFAPAVVLERLASWSNGNPQTLTELVARLKRQGLVTPSQRGDGWIVATAELESLPAAPARQWLATRALAELAPELAACVRVCAVLGTSFTRDELAEVAEALEAAGGAGTSVDVDIALAELIRRGHLERDDDGHHDFKSFAFRDALVKLIADADRYEIHTHAANHWQSRHLADGRSLERFAHHASRCGRRNEAAHGFIALADADCRAHDYVTADERYSAGLQACADQQLELRARALAGRGRARYHLHRTDDALADLAAASALAAELADNALLVDILLDQATTADSAAEFAAAAELAARANELAADLTDARIEARCVLASGRSAWRRGELDRALGDLTAAAELGTQLADPDTVIIAELLLGPALVCAGAIPRAQMVFERVITRCQEHGDRLHECAAYGNRLYLWSALNQTEAAIADLRQTIAIAREIGNPEPERVATHNLAELLLWSGRLDEALPLAQRSRVLQQRFWRNVANDAVLLARVHAALGDNASASDNLAWVDENCSPASFDPTLTALISALRLVLTNAPRSSWTELEERVEELASEEALEVLWWSATTALRNDLVAAASATMARAQRLLDEAPLWRPQFAKLELAAAIPEQE